MISASVSNLELFRCWKHDEELTVEWLKERIMGPFERTPQMIAGEAFHKALEIASLGEVETIQANCYRFEFMCESSIEVTPFREVRCSKEYGDLKVRGRADSIIGKLIVDYKTTAQFDPERLLNGYQWRYYLDMTLADRFRWNVFVLDEMEDFRFAVRDVHTLEQNRYPDLESDCLKLAREYSAFAAEHLVKPAEASLLITDHDLAVSS